ncbi:MAG: pilus assembly protein [Acidimicrobiia bacterium]|nr:pilus assembly protein [Acidimicrobiia bacterium]
MTEHGEGTSPTPDSANRPGIDRDAEGPAPRKRQFDDRGAAIVETALLAPVVLVVLFGILEFGLIYRDYLTVTDGITDGARIGSIAGPEVRSAGPGGGGLVTADYLIVDRIRRATGTVPFEWIDRIVIFEAGPPGLGNANEQIPATCADGSGAGARCNVYDAQEAFAAVETGDALYFDCTQNPASPSCGWNPRERNDGPRPQDIDYLGVWIRVDRPYVTGIFGEDFELSTGLIVRLEPGSTSR